MFSSRVQLCVVGCFLRFCTCTRGWPTSLHLLLFRRYFNTDGSSFFFLRNRSPYFPVRRVRVQFFLPPVFFIFLFFLLPCTDKDSITNWPISFEPLLSFLYPPSCSARLRISFPPPPPPSYVSPVTDPRLSLFHLKKPFPFFFRSRCRKGWLASQWSLFFFLFLFCSVISYDVTWPPLSRLKPCCNFFSFPFSFG